MRRSLLLGKVAGRVQDGEILHLLKLMLKAAGKRGVRLAVVRKAVVDILGKESDAECARRLGTVNAALQECGLRTYPNEKALAVAIGRIRRSRP